MYLKGGYRLNQKLFTKIGTIHKDNSQFKTAVMLGIIVTAFIGWMSWSFQGVSYISYMDKNKIWEVLAILPSMLVILFLHEMIHVGFFHLFGKGKAKIVPKREKELGAIIMHQVNSDVFYTRNQMFVILLSPLVLLTFLLLLCHVFIPLPFLIFINIVLNSIGSSTDIYVSYRLLTRYSSQHMINFDSDDHIMNLYERS